MFFTFYFALALLLGNILMDEYLRDALVHQILKT